jgi:hypothetical protein
MVDCHRSGNCGLAEPGVGHVCQVDQLRRVRAAPGSLTLVLGAAGLKYNVAGNLLLSGSVLWPFSDAGLRSRWSAVVGLDYAF